MIFRYCPAMGVIPVSCRIQNSKLSLQEMEYEVSEGRFDSSTAE